VIIALKEAGTGFAEHAVEVMASQVTRAFEET
jgi:hypothetical protein